jgi:hypothetical protein
MNYFDSDMSNITNTVVYFDGKDGILTFADNVAHNLCCLIQADDNSSTCTFMTKVSLIDGASVTIILCLYLLIAHCIFIDLEYVDYFQ